ncbi:MAG: hypothetical protein D6753_13740 [Planctomycetota bacterium]|nr:MAG: hypothetical protein D6753_13740 [Planctomycetota bacterium]
MNQEFAQQEIGMRFLAIDFETASSNANSACQLAAVEVIDGAVAGQHCWLIRPPRMYFSPRNIEIHGIRPQDVRSAPTMEEVWVELQSVVDGQILVAHNAGFDMGVLVASLAAYDIACPQLEFTCTRTLARAAWPGRQRYGLKPLGDWLGIAFKHHDALEDARACAEIAMAAAAAAQAADLGDLGAKLRVSRGRVHNGTICNPRRFGRSRAGRTGDASATVDSWGVPTRQSQRNPGAWNTAAVLAAAGTSRPLTGKRIWLLGPLSGLTMEASQDLIRELGGECVTGVDEHPHFVVTSGSAGPTANEQLRSGASDHASGESRAESSPPATAIRILSERQFRALLPAGKSVPWNS